MGKSTISLGHFPWQTVSHNQLGFHIARTTGVTTSRLAGQELLPLSAQFSQAFGGNAGCRSRVLNVF